MALGQAAPTMSGGEAQRVKLAAELARPNTGRTVYLLDEPTTGLHFDDIRKLLDVLNRLVDLGNTVIVVEHNLDVIKTADWVIDLGPEAGAAGGTLVAQGPPEAVAQVAASHTGAILKDVLAAGPHAERPRYDPHQAEAQRQDDVALEQVGKDAKMPWETDGRRWHTELRVTNEGKPCRWEGKVVEWLDQQIHAFGTFSPTNWNHRSVYEVAAAQKSQGWFLHGMTSREWVLRLVFRVGRNRFKAEELNRRLGIPPLNDTPGLEVYSNEPRVHVANRKGPWQEVAVIVHRLSEIDTAPFKQFLKEAVQAFQDNLKRLRTKPEDVMPWKVNGERWHLGDKGFAPGRKVYWDRGVLANLLKLVREVEPQMTVKWDTRDGITIKVPGVSRSWAQFRTKDCHSLDCRFLGKRGQFNLSAIEKIGVGPEIKPHTNGDLLRLRFQQPEQVQGVKLKQLLTEHLRGFREVFGGVKEEPLSDAS
jgi:excinuclease ABC subunit A